MNDLLKRGMEWHQKGDREDALICYEKSWQESPSVDVAYLLGLVHFELDHVDDARKWLSEADQFGQKQAQVYCLLGDIELKQENTEQAKKAYQKSLSCNPKMHQSLYGLGKLSLKENDLDVALQRFHDAVALCPQVDLYWVAFIQLLIHLKKFKDAHSVMAAAKKNCPHSKSLDSLAKQLKQLDGSDLSVLQKRFKESVQSGNNDQVDSLAKEMLRLYPEDKSSLYMYANFLAQTKRFEDALPYLRQIVNQDSSIPVDVWILMARCYGELGNYEKCFEFVKRAESIADNRPNLFLLKGIALVELGRLDEAIASYVKAYSLREEDCTILLNLGNAFLKKKSYKEAYKVFCQILNRDGNHIYALKGASAASYHMERDSCPNHIRICFDICRKIIRLRPNDCQTKSNLASILFNMDLIDKGLKQVVNVLSLGDKYKFDSAHLSASIFHSNYSSLMKPEEIAALHHKWSRLYESELIVENKSIDWKNKVASQRKLRVGFLSGDFSYHPVAYFLEPFIDAIDRTQFEIIALSTTLKKDQFTSKLNDIFDEWYNVCELGNKELSLKGRELSLDILIDISGHTTNNRLLGVAGRMAPIQVEWLGYPNTTGLRSMDYRITDAITEPEGDADEYSSEKLIRLPYGFHVYKPYYQYPEVTICPWVSEGFITFGSFNNVMKLTSEVIALWSKILKRVPNSKLLLKDRNLDYQENKDRILSLFVLNGVSTKRIELMVLLKSNASHLNAYSRIDIALDPFPYNGTTTTCEALYMGVPVIALLGNRHASRVTSSILTHMGRPEWVAQNKEEYVHIATELASEPQKMLAYRKTQRQMMKDSALCDVKRFTSDMQNALKTIWTNWCMQQENLEERKESC